MASFGKVAALKPAGAKPSAPIAISKAAPGQPSSSSNDNYQRPRTASTTTSAPTNFNRPIERAVSPPNSFNRPPASSAKSPPVVNRQPVNRAPLAHKNSQMKMGNELKKANYGTIIRNWNTPGASKPQLAMLEKKDLLPLLMLHRHNNVKVQSVASEVIEGLIETPDGSVAMDPAKVNGFRPLVEIYKREDVDLEVQILVVKSLAHLAAHPACQAPIMNEVGWFNIPKFARAPEMEMKIACAILLGNLAAEPKNQKLMIEKGVPLLLENLKEATHTDLKAALLSAFADISEIKDYGAKQIWDDTLLQYTIPSVMNDSSQNEQLSAVSLLCNICDTDSAAVHKEITTCGVVDKLNDLLLVDNEDLLGNIALIFNHLGKSAIGLQKLETLSNYRKLSAGLTAKDPTVQLQVAEALDVLVSSDTIKKKLKAGECIETLEEIILSSNTTEQVETVALRVLKKLDSDACKIVEEKLAAAPKIRRVVEPAPEVQTLEFSKETVKSPRTEETKPAPPPLGEILSPRRASMKTQPVDPSKLQRDHELEVQRLNEEKRRLQEQLLREREREAELAANNSKDINFGDKIKDGLKSIHESINLEVDSLNLEKKKIEEWKNAIENFRREKLQFEKDLAALKRDREQLDKDSKTLASDRSSYAFERERLDKDKASLKSDVESLGRQKSEWEKEKAALEKDKDRYKQGKAEDSSKDREKLEKLEKENDKLEEKLEKERKKADEDRARFELLIAQLQQDLERSRSTKGGSDAERKALEEERKKLEAEREKFRNEKSAFDHRLSTSQLEHELQQLKIQNQQLLNDNLKLEKDKDLLRDSSQIALERTKYEAERGEKEREHESRRQALENETKRLEKEKAELAEERERVAKYRESAALSLGTEAGRVIELENSVQNLQKMLKVLEETAQDTKKANLNLEAQVDQLEEEKAKLEEELAKKNEKPEESDSSSSSSEGNEAKEQLEELRSKMEELARMWEAEKAELEEKNRLLTEELERLKMNSNKPAEGDNGEDENTEKDKSDKEDDGEDGDKQKEGDDLANLDADELEKKRKQIEADLKKVAAWETAKQNEKEENQKRLAEEIELLKNRHMSWERKKGIMMADLVQKENALYEREQALHKLDDELYEREQKVLDLETRQPYTDSESDGSHDRTEISHSDDDRHDRKIVHSGDDWTDSGDDKSVTESLVSIDSDSDYSIDPNPPRKVVSPSSHKSSKSKSSHQGRHSRASANAKLQASSPKPSSSPKPKNELKTSGASVKSTGSRPPSRAPYEDLGLDDVTPGEDVDDDDDLYSVEGLAQSDPYEAARTLLNFLELDPSRPVTEQAMDTLRKFAKTRSGAPTQYEARDVIPALVHILSVCSDPSHEGIINTCLLILAILAFNKDANQIYIRRAKGGPLIEEFLGFSLPSVKARAALALAAYCLNNTPIKMEVGRTAIPTLVALLQQDDRSIKKGVSTALAALVDDNKWNKKLVKKQNGLKMMLDLLRDNQIPPKYSLHLLASMANNGKSIKKDIPKYYPQVFRKIILLLSPYSKAPIIVAAVAALMELARNNPKNQLEIRKAGAAHYLITILVAKERYNNDDLMANTLFLIWTIARSSKKGLADPVFESPKWKIGDILNNLKDIHNEAVKKLIYNLENMIRTAEAAKGAGSAPVKSVLASSK